MKIFFYEICSIEIHGETRKIFPNTLSSSLSSSSSSSSSSSPPGSFLNLIPLSFSSAFVRNRSIAHFPAISDFYQRTKIGHNINHSANHVKLSTSTFTPDIENNTWARVDMEFLFKCFTR